MGCAVAALPVEIRDEIRQDVLLLHINFHIFITGYLLICQDR
jgi:hypothetical protein